MKFALITLSFLFVQSLSFAQQTSNSIDGDIYGVWDVVFLSDGSLNDSLVESTQKEKASSGSNHNIAVLTYKANGDFHLASIRDYNASEEIGTFVISDDKKAIVHTVKTPNAFDEKDRNKIFEKNAQILYFKKDVLVLKMDRGILYMKRMS